MRRRDFIKVIAGSAVTWPIAAPAQPERVRRIGVILATTADDAEFQAMKIRLGRGALDAGREER